MGTKRKRPAARASASARIDARIAELDDWRGRTLARLRQLIRQADPGVTEEWKWGGPVWSHDGIICTGETYKEHVKLTFARGAALDDPRGVFNASLEGNTRRAIDVRAGETIDERAFTALVRAAVAVNARPRLLSGENPQVPKAEGDAPVQAYGRALLVPFI